MTGLKTIGTVHPYKIGRPSECLENYGTDQVYFLEPGFKTMSGGSSLRLVLYMLILNACVLWHQLTL